MQAGDEEEDEGGPRCLSKLCELGTFAKTGPEMKYLTCPDLCPVVNPREMSSSFESGSIAGRNDLFFYVAFLW